MTNFFHGNTSGRETKSMRTNYVPMQSGNHPDLEHVSSGVDREGAEFIGNKQIRSLIHIYRRHFIHFVPIGYRLYGLARSPPFCLSVHHNITT